LDILKIDHEICYNPFPEKSGQKQTENNKDNGKQRKYLKTKQVGLGITLAVLKAQRNSY
jgi:hypothetical protein